MKVTYDARDDITKLEAELAKERKLTKSLRGQIGFWETHWAEEEAKALRLGRELRLARWVQERLWRDLEDKLDAGR